MNVKIKSFEMSYLADVLKCWNENLVYDLINEERFTEVILTLILIYSKSLSLITNVLVLHLASNVKYLIWKEDLNQHVVG